MNAVYTDPEIIRMLNTFIEFIGIGFTGLLLVIVFVRGIIGILCKNLAREKGYKGYYWVGFFFGWLGILYVSFLPDLKLRKYLRMCSMRMQIMDDRLDDLENIQ